MSKEDLFQIIMEHLKLYCREDYFKKKFPEHYQILLTWDFPTDFKFSQKLYHYFNDDPELKLGLCPVCGRRCGFYRFGEGYKKHCSQKCAYENPETIEKRKQTCVKFLGVEYPAQNKDVMKKVDETNYEKYGCRRYSQTIECKNCVKQTNNDLYGEDYYSKTDEFKERVENTNIKLYGHKQYSQTKECKEKTRKTNRERYNKDNYTQTDEYKIRVYNTNMMLYGCKCTLHSKEIEENVKQIMIDKYGVDSYMKTNEFFKKSQETIRKLYNVDYYSQTQECKDKVKQTCLDRYGVEHYSQTEEFAKFHRKRIEFDDLTFDSSWEIDVYEYCKENNIMCEYQPNITFEYEYNNKKHYYHPDFLINGKLYEVKGEHFFDNDKMINPYDRTQDALYEAKHQCMKNNGVIILRDVSYNTLNKYLKGGE